MVRLAHIVKLMETPPGSEWAVAQPITLESMRRARKQAHDIEVNFFAVASSSDSVPTPDEFRMLRPLDRDARSVGQPRATRPLPIFRDVLDRLFEATDAEYFAYTNIDIALMPQFYSAVASIIKHGHDAIVINRRTIPAAWNSPADLPAMYACGGKPHPGFDCFVFRRDRYLSFILGDVCLGSGHVDTPLICSMIAAAGSFRFVTDAHLTFHLGDSRSWMRWKYRDERRHNDREAAGALLALAGRSNRSLRLPHRIFLRLHLIKNAWIVAEFRRLFSR